MAATTPAPAENAHAPAPIPHRAPRAAHEARRPWTTLVLLAVAQFMVILDITVVNVALPSIGTALGFAADELQWVVTAYVLFTGGLMLFGGRLADLVGRRPVFLAGLAVFTAASLLSGLAWSPESLIASRALQGVGAAFLLPSALSILTTSYRGAQQATALAVWGAIGSAGAAAGVLLGGVLTETVGWRWIFFVNVPAGLAVGTLVLRLAPTARAAAPRGRLDLVGASSLMAGVVALVLAVEGASDRGWGSTYTLGLGAVAAAALAVFLLAERRVRQPLIAPATWRIRSLVTGAGVLFVATGVLVGGFFLNTLYLQGVMGMGAMQTGLALLPMTVVILAGAHLASQLLPRVGSRSVVVAGLGLTAGGALLLAGAPVDGRYVADLLPGHLALGAGVGMTFVAVSVAAMADVTADDAGLASGLMTTAHELGAAIGVAVLATVAAAGLAAQTPAGVAAGFGDGLLVGAVVAGVAAALAGVLVPSVRPEAGAARGGLH